MTAPIWFDWPILLSGLAWALLASKAPVWFGQHLHTGEGVREATDMPPRDTMNGNPGRTPLSDYVRAYMARQGLSHNQLAKRGRDPESGNRILVQWLLDMVNGEVARAPELWRLRALAAALATREGGSVDLESFRRELGIIKKLAAAQWFDMPEVLEVQTADGSIITVSVPPDLPEDKREKVREWAEDMARMLAEGA